MRIYLTQHGLAVPDEVDPQRPLSDRGRQDVRNIARFLGAAGVRVARMVHSGKLRAEQTALELAGALAPGIEVKARRGLAPKDPVAPVAEWLGELDADTLLAGHQPFLGRLTSLLLAGDPDGVSLGFAPGSVACLEAQPGGTWSLLWMVRPELLSAPGA